MRPVRYPASPDIVFFFGFPWKWEKTSGRSIALPRCRLDGKASQRERKKERVGGGGRESERGEHPVEVLPPLRRLPLMKSRGRRRIDPLPRTPNGPTRAQKLQMWRPMKHLRSFFLCNCLPRRANPLCFLVALTSSYISAYLGIFSLLTVTVSCLKRTPSALLEEFRGRNCSVSSKHHSPKP